LFAVVIYFIHFPARTLYSYTGSPCSSLSVNDCSLLDRVIETS